MLHFAADTKNFVILDAIRARQECDVRADVLLIVRSSDSRSKSSAKGARITKFLPGEVREGFVRFRHLMRILSLLYCLTFVLCGQNNFIRESRCHRSAFSGSS